MNEHPFWSDDFDMDLPKVIPEARAIVAPIANIGLWTTGGTTHDALNHPDVWNHEDGTIAYFGFRDSARPDYCYTHRGPIRCTAWEAFRDAWAHQYLMLVEHEVVWNTGPLWLQFQDIMWNLRGWGLRAKEAERAKRVATKSMRLATERLKEVAARHGVGAPAS